MINWDRVRELRNDMGAEDFDDIVDIFLDEVAETAAKLRDAETAKALEMHLHSLKNGALNLGFYELSDLCQTGESLAGADQADSVDLTKIHSVLDASLGQFKTNLPNQLTG